MKVEIVSENGITKVFMNGEEVQGVKSVEFEHFMNDKPVITLSFYCDRGKDGQS